MISRVVASNFRSLGPGQELHLGPATVLVGPNGSGKSNLADVLAFISDALRQGLEAAILKRHGISAIRRWSRGRPFDVTIRVELEAADERRLAALFDWALAYQIHGLKASYELVLTGSRTGDYRIKSESAQGSVVYETPSGPKKRASDRFGIANGTVLQAPTKFKGRIEVDPTSLFLPLLSGQLVFRAILDVLKNVGVYSIFPDVLREPQRPDIVTPMKKHGENWCSILRSLPGHETLAATLERLTGEIDAVRVRSVATYLATEFRHRVEGKGKWVPADQESDGTLRVAGMATALLQGGPLTLIGIEEPELAVHPGALPLLHDLIREGSNRSQVLITTHHPDLLDLFEPDEIRVVERRNQSTTVTALDPGQKKAVKERLMTLGDLARTEGLQQTETTRR